jgi:hypothetical protein
MVQRDFAVDVESEQVENMDQHKDEKAALPVVVAPREVQDVVIPWPVPLHHSLQSKAVKR